MNFSKFVIKLLIPTYITSTMNPIICGMHPSDPVFYQKKESILSLLEHAIRYGDINKILERIKDSHLSINTLNTKKQDLREPEKAKPKKKEEDQYNDREKEEDEETPEPEQKARFIPNDTKPRGKPKKRKRK